MKKRNRITALLLIIILALAASAAYLYRKNQKLSRPVSITHYKFSPQSIQEIRNNATQPNAVFIGNSITEEWNKYSPHFMEDNNYINAGIGGQVSAPILLRFQNDVIDLHPKTVVISAGINDIAENWGEYNPKFTLDNIKTMANAAEANGIKVLIASVLPVNEVYWNPNLKGIPQKIKDLNRQLKQYAQDKQYEYIDYYTPMLGDDEALKPQYTRDGVHLTKQGYAVLEAIAKESIDKVINQPN